MHKPQRVIITIIVSIAIWLLLTLTTYFTWIRGADHRDFYPRWAGARLALFEGRDLYSAETTRAMQIMLYGMELPPDVDPQAFAYPALIVPLLLPFWLIADVEIATAAWEATSVIFISSTLLLISRSLRSSPSYWVIIMLLLWYYPILMIFQAQFTALPLMAVGVGCWAYFSRHDWIAGPIVVVGFIKPEQVFLPIILLLLMALREHRWRVLMGFIIAGSILFVTSVMIAGWWVFDWLNAVQRYAGYAPTNWVPATLWQMHPLVLIICIAFIVMLFMPLRANAQLFVAATVPLNLLLLPQTLIWGLTLLLFPLLQAWHGRTRYAVIGIWLLGWVLILGSNFPDWWRVPSSLLPFLTLIAISYASREQALT